MDIDKNSEKNSEYPEEKSLEHLGKGGGETFSLDLESSEDSLPEKCPGKSAEKEEIPHPREKIQKSLRDLRIFWLSFISQVNTVGQPLATLSIAQREEAIGQQVSSLVHAHYCSIMDNNHYSDLKDSLQKILKSNEENEEKLLSQLFPEKGSPEEDVETLISSLNQLEKERKFDCECSVLLNLIPRRKWRK